MNKRRIRWVPSWAPPEPGEAVRIPRTPAEIWAVDMKCEAYDAHRALMSLAEVNAIQRWRDNLGDTTVREWYSRAANRCPTQVHQAAALDYLRVCIEGYRDHAEPSSAEAAATSAARSRFRGDVRALAETIHALAAVLPRDDDPPPRAVEGPRPAPTSEEGRWRERRSLCLRLRQSAKNRGHLHDTPSEEDELVKGWISGMDAVDIARTWGVPQTAALANALLAGWSEAEVDHVADTAKTRAYNGEEEGYRTFLSDAETGARTDRERYLFAIELWQAMLRKRAPRPGRIGKDWRAQKRPKKPRK